MRVLLILALLAGGLPAAPALVILVRHAERDSQATDAPINAAGRDRAQELAHVLEAWTATGIRIRALFATERQRTQQTLEPLSASVHVPITVVNAKETGTLVNKILAFKGGLVVVAGHSNTLPEIMEALGAPSGIEIADTDFSHLFVLTKPGTSPTPVVDLRYGKQ
jgi:phosphohistidine phosphatase SixA